MNDDDFEIARLTDLAGDGARIDYSVQGNPFRINNEEELFSARIETNRKLHDEEEMIRKFSLVQRTECTRPRVPPIETRATRIHSSQSQRSNYSAIQTVSNPTLPPEQSSPMQIDGFYDHLASSRTSNSIATVGSNCDSHAHSNISSNLPSNISSEFPSSRRTKSSLSNFSGSISNLGKNKTPRKKERTRKLTMHEFVDEKREIYRLQLFIDKKIKDIDKFSVEMNKSEKRLQDAETKIQALSDQYKIASIKIEAAVARRRKFADAAARTTSEKRRDLDKFKMNQQMLESELIKKEALLETYQKYRHFLTQFLEEDETIEEKFQSPETLLDALTKIEIGNLFLIKECQRISGIVNTSTNKIQEQLDSTIDLEYLANKQMNSIETVNEEDFSFTPAQEKSIESSEKEFENISKMIQKTYSNCFSFDQDLKPLTMLERIENKLEKMYELLVYVDPAFIEEKQAIKLRMRREMQRKAKQEKRNLEQKLKTEQAIERAKKPIPHRVGRPINHRIIPVKMKVRDDEKEKRKLLEQQAEIRLLYGPIE
ncbi:hypothetical protein TRFO_21933 [Tritrichomonas foetus]|uniref:DUF4200 domain-containing protein n=1 Tax=Tritrichomonas foetus TaxID=1144522 RepID=A0A1J4KIX2_9EUKA|nr:hypothetical protein TRFO_21933 [Tritrichomonas foetus]|eukprot:OHT09269.1 hypothetical protein TRFO_21933 [Tritrichomonas foetus]